MHPSRFIWSMLVVFWAGVLLAQTNQGRGASTSGGDALIQAASVATGGASFSDVVLSGTVRHIAGSTDENGRIELKALASGETSIEMSFPSGNFREVHAFNGRRPVGQWSGPDEKAHVIAEHNLLVDPAWFCPGFVLRRASTSADRVVIGEEASSQHARDHLRVSRKPGSGQGSASDQSVNSLTRKVLDAFQVAPQIDLYLDPATHLPVEMASNTHPDNNLGENIPVRVKYSDYRAVNSVQIPFHLQRFMNGTLVFDVQLESANLNTGLTSAAFPISDEILRSLPR